MKKLIYISIVGVLLLLMPAGWLLWQASTVQQPPAAVEILVPAGASTVKIGRLLHSGGVISSPLAFRLAVRLKGAGAGLRSGMYRFEQPANIHTIIERLESGDVMAFSVTLPEGLRTDEMLAILADKTGLGIEQWQQALKALLPGEVEGRLLPETYQYTKPVEPKRLLQSMIEAQKRLLEELSKDVNRQDRLRIMASIIEKETMLDNERPLVAAAIRNRLQKGMPLQMDPTVIYGIWRSTGSFSGNIHKQDLSTDTLWNTYTRRGLPPTPIGNPGAASLRAAANPADVDYLYFVADGTGGHKFAATLVEHQANVQQWIKIEKHRPAK
ncbi:MAG: ABC transporter substrate-binidng protein [Zetaproteobacteria bacterium CG1_02_53_45]|nr:MAG: ABC transporter substrate-binidng protein [Zetaproteobacteria bacterium CG1_02_53_45]